MTWKLTDERDAAFVAGIQRAEGRWNLRDGIVSRRGYRRIIPESGPDQDEIAEQTESMAAIATRVLHGRDATIFEGLVLNPLFGRPRRSVADLAAQFNIAKKRVYKIKDHCTMKLAKEIGKSASTNAPGNCCHECGRVYYHTYIWHGREYVFSSSNRSICKHGYNHLWVSPEARQRPPHCFGPEEKLYGMRGENSPLWRYY